MNERFIHIYSLMENDFHREVGCPVSCIAGLILYDKEKERIVGKLKFVNITNHIINSITVSIGAYDETGKEIQGVSELTYNNMNVEQNCDFGTNKVFILPDTHTKKFEVDILSVVYDKEMVWHKRANCSNNQLKNIGTPVTDGLKNPSLIKCPDCGNEVSKRAKVCIHCGCPLEELVTSGVVRIKIPSDIVYGWIGLFSSRKAVITSAHGKVIWEGSHGDNASFTIDEPTSIQIDLGGWANPVVGTVVPKKKYACIQDMGVHMLATYRLTEVDVIDAE